MNADDALIAFANCFLHRDELSEFVPSMDIFLRLPYGDRVECREEKSARNTSSASK